MRLLLTTIILTMLAQPVWAEDQLDQNEIREIIATTTNEGVASALASCLTQENEDSDDDPYCSCALKYRDVKTEAGFKVLYRDCTAPHTSAAFKDFLERMRKSKEPNPPISIGDIRALQEHVAKCWQPPIGSVGQETLTVDMNVRTDEQGYILSTEVTDKTRFALDPVFKATAIAAQRALVECSPLPISPEQRENFREFIFSFNPALLNKE